MPLRSPHLWLLAATAAILGASAAFARSPYPTRETTVDVNALARIVEHEDDHVTAVELAEWIKDRHAHLRVIDVRPTADFDAYHVPNAEHVELDELSRAHSAKTDTIVLYSEGGAHAAQGWIFLRALGYDHVYFLRGGVLDWLEQVMNPTLAIDASAKDSVEFHRAATVSRYFGGVPRTGVTANESTTNTSSTTVITRTRRRGC
jgi:rhodanese-related sulfurtransferase